MSRDTDAALEVLRAVWNERGQSREELDAEFGPAKSCKRMADINFDGLADPDAGGDARAAWREMLRREGKLSDQAESIRDLVLDHERARG